MKVSKQDNLIRIQFQFNPFLVSKVKTLDNRKYAPAQHCWYIPLQNSTESIEKLSKWGFQIDPELTLAALADHRKAKEAEALAVMPDTEFETPLPLYNYQKVGSAFLYKIGSGMLGDDPGSGKTIMALALVEKAKAEKVLVFCPSSVKFQWLAEIGKFLPSASAIVIDGTKEERIKQWRKDARIYIANYELLLRDFEEMNMREWGYIIADESHRIQNAQAKQSKAIKKLRAVHKIAMSGVPISNRVVELWNVLDFCNPGSMGSLYAFISRYCIKNIWGGIEGSINVDELRQKIKRYMIRRTTEEILPELPEKITVEVPFELSREERELYGKIKQELLFEIQKEDISKLENPMSIQMTLVKMLRLFQLTDSMELLGNSTKSTKVEVLKDLLKDVVVDGRKVVLYTKFSQFADILQRELQEYNPLKITGDVKDRQNIIDTFNTDTEHKILIITDAAAYGVNLQEKCSTIVLLDLPYSIGKLRQVEGRVYRIGQKRRTMIYYVIAKGTIDSYCKRILQRKEKLADDVLDFNDIKEMLL